MADEPENLVLQILRDIRGKMATKDDIAGVRSEMNSLRADVAADLHSLDAKVDRIHKELSNQIAGLRRDVVLYHSAIVGHGSLIDDLDTRVRRLEQHLNLPPHDAH